MRMMPPPFFRPPLTGRESIAEFEIANVKSDSISFKTKDVYSTLKPVAEIGYYSADSTNTPINGII
jgi:hypothetical protein